MGETVERVQDPAMDDSPNAGDPQAAAASQICVALSPVIQAAIFENAQNCSCLHLTHPTPLHLPLMAGAMRHEQKQKTIKKQ